MHLQELTASVPLIRSSLLTQFPNVDFGMSTVQGAPRSAPLGYNLGFNVGDDDETVQENIDRFISGFRITRDRLATMNQVHGTTIQEVTDPGVYLQTDAIVTTVPKLGLAVRTADCVPVMLYAPAEQIVAAVHAGWRGTAASIASRTVRFIQERFGTEPEELLAYIGPSAGKEQYEVDEDVAAHFQEEAVLREDGQKPHLDLKRANMLDLLSAGLNERNIDISPYCTISNPSLFHSYRRDGIGSGRMLALIMLREQV